MFPTKKAEYSVGQSVSIGELAAANMPKQALVDIVSLMDSVSSSVWQVVASCGDSIVKNIGDASPNKWTSASNLESNIPGSEHSWCILENSVTGWQFAIDCASTDAKEISVYLSVTGSFNTDGTLYNMPTASEKVSLRLTGHGDFLDDTDSQTRLLISVVHSSDSLSTFMVVTSMSSPYYLGNVVFGWTPVLGAPDSWPTSPKVAFLNSGYAVSNSLDWWSVSPNIQSITWTPQAFVRIERTSPVVSERWLEAGFALPSHLPFYNSLLPTQFGSLIVPLKYNMDSQSFPVSSAGLVSADPTAGGFLGYLRDFYVAGCWKNQTTFPADGSAEFCTFGSFVLPWGGLTPSRFI